MQVQAQPTTEDLVARLQRGDPEALAALYDRYAGQIYAYVRQSVDVPQAEELVQDIFLALWQKAALYDPARGAFGAWFFTLARNRVYDALPRYARRRAEASLSGDKETGALDIADGRADVEEQTLHLLRESDVRAALAQLPPDQRHAILMTYFYGLSQRELAEQLEVPISTIKGRSRMGLQRLRQLLPEY